MISIITPTYNRLNLLPTLYNALLRQTSKCFEWIIVDDGSTDSTKYIVEKWIQEDKVKIKYIYQENKGKYIAHNTGVKEANYELCICIDSDDYPTDRCVENILRLWKKKCNNKYAGIIALKTHNNGTLIGKKIPTEIKETTLFELTEKYKCDGDKALVYKTSILKENLFPEIEGINFITEDVIYNKIDVSYKMLVLNEVLCICEYQENGYSNNYIKLVLQNPNGFNIYYMQRIDMALDTYQRIVYSSKYHAFKWMSGRNNYRYKGKYSFIVNISILLGFIVYIYYEIKKRKLKI